MVVGWFAVRVEEIELGPQESHCSRRRLVPVLEGVGSVCYRDVSQGIEASCSVLGKLPGDV